MANLAPLPQRISLFALSSLAPLYLEVIAAVARRLDVSLYLHNPTDQYWADLVSEKRVRRRAPGAAGTGGRRSKPATSCSPPGAARGRFSRT